MLVIDRFDSSRVEKQSLMEAFVSRSTAAHFDVTAALGHGPFDRYIVHIVAEEASQRAAMARHIFEAGHHAEVYTDASELVDHRPQAGIVLAHESDNLGAAVVCKGLAEHGLWLPVIGFGAEVEPSRIVAGMKAGAMDFLIGPASAETTLEKLKACASEADARSQIFIRRVEAQSAVSKLSTRERQVLDLLTSGMSNKSIARELGISHRTVEIHRMKVIGKIGANSSVDAVRIAIDARNA